MSRNPRINVTFDTDTYEKIRAIAHKQNRDMSDVVREWAVSGLNGKLGADNIDLITQIIRDQLKAVMQPQIERLASIEAKTCIQASAAYYLTAEVLSKFVPEEYLENYYEVTEAARRKGVEYLKRKPEKE